MVKIMENPTKRDDLGEKPYFRKHLNIQQATGFLKNLDFWTEAKAPELGKPMDTWVMGGLNHTKKHPLNHMKSPVKRW